jgi:hypothetical protein
MILSFISKGFPLLMALMSWSDSIPLFTESLLAALQLLMKINR